MDSMLEERCVRRSAGSRWRLGLAALALVLRLATTRNDATGPRAEPLEVKHVPVRRVNRELTRATDRSRQRPFRSVSRCGSAEGKEAITGHHDVVGVDSAPPVAVRDVGAVVQGPSPRPENPQVIEGREMRR